MRLAGYSTAALTFPPGLMRDRVALVRSIFHEAGIETALRIDLTCGSRQELLRLLRRYRNLYDVIAVKCSNQAVANIACRDRRVDIVFFDIKNARVKFTHAMANLLRGALEFNIVSNLLNESSDAFLRLARDASLAGKHRNKVVLSSGCFSPQMIRSPSQIASLGSMIGLPIPQCKEAVSSLPATIVARNIERRSREYVEEGVKIVLPKAR
jgi:RNase P/RNase MRP subunit p30